ncbi:MAG: sigma-70 family RNA polymerase sigma factor, partial [Pirellulaceae bacterium]
DSRYSFRTWLWTILLNVCRRQAQKMSRQRCASLQHSDPAGEAMNIDQGHAAPLEGLIRDERREQIQALLSSLSDTHAEAIRLRFFGEMKFQEIADAQGCTLSAAKARVRNGLIQLSRLLASTEESQLALVGEGSSR